MRRLLTTAAVLAALGIPIAAMVTQRDRRMPTVAQPAE